jgi:hypothetical protein
MPSPSKAKSMRGFLYNRKGTGTIAATGGTTASRRATTKVSFTIILTMVLVFAAFVRVMFHWTNQEVVSLRASPPDDLHSFAAPHQEQHPPSPPKTTTTSTTATTPIRIAYAISLIKCGDHQSNAGAMSDSATVLRHSIHQNSIRNPSSNSRYDYKVYAIVHRQAEACSQQLADAGFEILLRDPPVLTPEIQGDYLRSKIHREVCCGADEFVKLYAYTIFDGGEPLVVHLDLDFIIRQPMDDLFDAMLLPSNSVQGQAARKRIPLERPTDPWPDRVDLFMTKDWPQVMPGRRALYQAGFQVVRPDQQVFDTIVDVIRKGDYKEGFGRDNGWGSKGYGGSIGSMAMQGLLAYIYDEILPDHWVELNQCRYNHMGMDVLYRHQPAFQPKHPKVGQCRNDLEYCEDCMTTELNQIYSIHYTACRKPWMCPSVGDKQDKGNRGKTIPEDAVLIDHCLELHSVWHSYRSDLEDKLMTLTGDEAIRQTGQAGQHMANIFQGHCEGHGGSNYIGISGSAESLKRIPELYE